MSILLHVLLWNTVLLLALLVLQGMLVPLTHGFQWGLGSRDKPKEPSVAQGRAARTVANHLEGMAMYLPLALIGDSLALTGTLVTWGAGLFLGGRVAFTGFYLGGVAVLRSAAWGVSLTGLVLLFVAIVRTVYGS